MDRHISKKRRVVGYGAIVLGTASTIVFMSPIFPIGFEAFLFGAFFFGVAYWALANPSLSRIIRRFIPGAMEPAVPVDPMLPVRILRHAREHRGITTVSEVSISLNIPIADAEAGLRECVRTGTATEDFDMKRGYAIYRFPELAPPDSTEL